ncbi:MAG: trimethylamine methyltransferase family protein [Pseudomonadota bacterium]
MIVLPRNSLGMETLSDQKRPRRRRRRSIASQSVTSAPGVRHIPRFELLDEAALKRIETHAGWLLETVGVEFRGDDTALELFRNAGARVKGFRVTFPSDLARELCGSAPGSFELISRNPERTLHVGGESLIFMPGYGSPFVTDLDRGRRYATLEDFRNFVRLTHTTLWLHHSGGVICEPVDLPVNKRHLDMVLGHLTLSDKPFMGAVTSIGRARDSIAMARIVHGPAMDRDPVMQGNININSPFVFDDTMSGALRTYAAAGQCVCVSPAIFGGMMGPVTPAAIAAQTLAEGMAGIALTQLVKPGCPAVLGSFHTTVNLRSGSVTFGTPEANLVTMALSQLGRRLGVPVRSGGGQITAANAPDGQAMADSVNAMWSTVLSGTHQVWHAAGWLEGGLTMSFEKFVLDADCCGAMLRMAQGLEVSAETLTRGSYSEAGPGDNFLSTAHTLRHYATANYEPLLPDAGSYEAWADNGRRSAAERASGVWKRMLADYEPPDLAPGVQAELQDFVSSRKAGMADEWY